MNKLDGKVAIVTGAAGGIGQAIAELFAAQGAKLLLADWNKRANEEVAQSINQKGGFAIAAHVDVGKAEQVREMINQAIGKYQRVDILVNNAGFGSAPAPIHATDNDDWDRVVNVCLKGVFLGMKYVIPQMMEQGGGSIVNIASIAGILGSMGLAPYGAAKAGVIELTKTGAVEYSKYNIRCNAIAPGWTQTSMLAGYTGENQELQQKMLKSIPMRRFGNASEVAETALFLAGEDAEFIQGQTIVIDGGLTIL